MTRSRIPNDNAHCLFYNHYTTLHSAHCTVPTNAHLLKQATTERTHINLINEPIIWYLISTCQLTKNGKRQPNRRITMKWGRFTYMREKEICFSWCLHFAQFHANILTKCSSNQLFVVISLLDYRFIYFSPWSQLWPLSSMAMTILLFVECWNSECF